MQGVARSAEAFERQAWGEVHAILCAQPPGSLGPEDLERLAVSAYLLGRDEDSARAWEEAHLSWLDRGDPARAALSAFWMGFAFLLHGETARSGGWLARARRLVEDGDLDCVARGYLLIPRALQALEEGDPLSSHRLASDAVQLAKRFGDADLLALARLALGDASIALGNAADGLALLDEVMVATSTGEVSPIPAGLAYCAVLGTCMRVFDLRRASEWTDALRRWCEAQPDLVPYRGQCLVHRSQILQANGRWAEAVGEAERARHHLSHPLHPALGLALYQRAELHRLRGELVEAEEVYRQASRYGYEPAPGLALLRLAEGRVEAAATAIRRMLEETADPLARPELLAACVEIMVAADDVPAARRAVDELSKIAEDLDAQLIHAVVAFAEGAVLLAEDRPGPALAALRRACGTWTKLGVPYHGARARVLVAVACRSLGDEEAASSELAAAASVLEELGAERDLTRVRALQRPTTRTTPGGLTARELRVLQLVAAGMTNRDIGAELAISEHTVARHVQNIFTKLGVSSRASATALAYEQRLL